VQWRKMGYNGATLLKSSFIGSHCIWIGWMIGIVYDYRRGEVCGRPHSVRYVS
jgi:hypothetical protein